MQPSWHRGAPGSGDERHGNLPRLCELLAPMARQIKERLGIPACFCAPRHPWEKGTNDNANGLLRGFFPKGRSLDGAADAEANAAYCGR